MQNRNIFKEYSYFIMFYTITLIFFHVNVISELLYENPFFLPNTLNYKTIHSIPSTSGKIHVKEGIFQYFLLYSFFSKVEILWINNISSRI